MNTVVSFELLVVRAKSSACEVNSVYFRIHCVSTVGSGPCVQVHPRSSRDGVDAPLDGWIPRTPSRRLAAGVVELGKGGGTSGAYIVSVVSHPYLTTLLPLWLTMSSCPSTTPVVLVVRHVSAGKGVDLTCVKSTVRPLRCRPYLCQVDHTIAGVSTLLVSASRVGLATSAGQLSEGARTWQPGQHLPYHSSPPPEDLLEVPDEGAEDEVLSRQELRNLNGAGVDPTEQEIENSNGVRADPTEQKLENWNGAGADPTEQELGNWNGTGADPTEQELINLNGVGADPTEQELGNLNGAGADPIEYELGNWNDVGADPTEQELRNLNGAGAREFEWCRS
ncbi:hypothetical protein BHM03_00033808 [Ensete ventricosum]|nr:hypothetical protein BHM03_00033808 [Ensete ventricosum]